MSQLFQRKPIAELVEETHGLHSLKRSLGAGDLIMLAIGAVIGRGIVGGIGTAAAGAGGPNGEVVRVGAGPALVLSFVLLGAACMLAGLCYAELAAMIPQAGSAYAYSYATLGELVAWIIGWDLILEYAVGNVAVAISWGDYFNTLVQGLGIQQAGAIVFFADIGFDALSTAAEDTRNPQRNLPIGILGGLAICTLIYVVVGAVLTGMVPYTQLAVADPLARALQLAGFTKISGIVALGATVSMSAVLLVFQYGQPRIFFAMGRDGLLPPWAARVHPRTRIPAVTTIITGIFVAPWALVRDAGETYDLTHIGTLFAFMLVSIGVLVLRHREPDRR